MNSAENRTELHTTAAEDTAWSTPDFEIVDTALEVTAYFFSAR